MRVVSSVVAVKEQMSYRLPGWSCTCRRSYGTLPAPLTNGWNGTIGAAKAQRALFGRGFAEDGEKSLPIGWMVSQNERGMCWENLSSEPMMCAPTLHQPPTGSQPRVK
jgi:hypothetical protein